jgi:molecular chaperone DnaK
MARTVGIDLGTTESLVAVLLGSAPEVLPNAEGSRITPSVVHFRQDGECWVGEPALRRAALEPETTVTYVKRLMGRRYSEIATRRSSFSYPVIEGPGGLARIRIHGQEYAPEEISAAVLRKLKRDAEAYLGETVDRAVITVPAYFAESQRAATRLAGELAGLEVLRLVSEPTAASLAYGLGRRSDETVLIYDLGGGSFDVSIVDISDGLIEVKASCGDTQLGGKEWDERVAAHLAFRFLGKEDADPHSSPTAWARLCEAAERARVALSSTLSVEVDLPYLLMRDGKALHLRETLTRETPESMTAPLLERTRGPVERALKDAWLLSAGPEPDPPGLQITAIDRVLLAGGCTRMPMVQEFVRGLLRREPERRLNLDEAVALGAAVEAGVLSGALKDILLLDVVPFSTGVELSGALQEIIAAGTTIPTRQTVTLDLARHSVRGETLRILQGIREEDVFYFRCIGTLTVPDIAEITPAEQTPGANEEGVDNVQVQVTLDFDANGILRAEVRLPVYGAIQSGTFTGVIRGDEADVARMHLQAAHRKQEAAAREEWLTLADEAERLTLAVERELSSRPTADAARATELTARIRRALEAVDRSEVQALMQALSALS